jgi:hypothetical protein
MTTVTVTYTCKYRLKTANNYLWTLCGKCYNLKSGRLIKQVYKGGCIGYVINGKFKSLKALRKELEIIPKTKYYPFKY